MEVMVATDVATTERGTLMRNQDTPEAMVMVVMEAMDVDTMARGKRMLQLRLMLSQDTTPEVMDMEVMVAMDVATMARGKLAMVVMVMVAMDVATMARGKLAMVVMDMVVMAVHMEVMVYGRGYYGKREAGYGG